MWLFAVNRTTSMRPTSRDVTLCATRAVTSRSHNDAMTDREDAWNAVHEALPAGWTVGPPTFDPGVPGWSITARTVAANRLKRPQTGHRDRSR